MVKQSMIFAAGLGTRMLPITSHLPKPLIKIYNKSILKTNIEKLLDAGFKKIIINAFHFSNKIVNEAKDYHPIVKVIIEKDRLETGGGVLNAIKQGYLEKEEPVRLLNGDIFWINEIYNSLDKIRNMWNSNQMDILLCLTKKENFFGYQGKGDFELLNPKKKVSSIFLKNECPFAYTGLQIVKPELISTKKKKFSIKEIIYKLCEQNKAFGYLDRNPWFHIGTYEDLIKFEDNFK